MSDCASETYQNDVRKETRLQSLCEHINAVVDNCYLKLVAKKNLTVTTFVLVSLKKDFKMQIMLRISMNYNQDSFGYAISIEHVSLL